MNISDILHTTLSSLKLSIFVLWAATLFLLLLLQNSLATIIRKRGIWLREQDIFKLLCSQFRFEVGSVLVSWVSSPLPLYLFFQPQYLIFILQLH